MKKNLLSGLLASAIAISCFSSLAFAELIENGDDIIYNGLGYKASVTYSDNLDSYADVDAMATNKWKGSNQYVSLVDGKSGKAIKIVNNGEDEKTETEWYRDIGVACAGNKIVVSEDVKFGNNTSSRTLLAFLHWKTPSATAVGLTAEKDGFFHAGDKTLAYEADTWYNVKAILDVEAHTMDIYVDNNVLAENIAIDETFSYITRLTPAKQNGSAEENSYVIADNFKAYSLTDACIESKNMITLKDGNYGINETTGFSQDFNSFTTSNTIGDAGFLSSGTLVDEGTEHKTAVSLHKDSSDVEIYKNLSGAFTNMKGIHMFTENVKFSNVSTMSWLLFADCMAESDFLMCYQGKLQKRYVLAGETANTLTVENNKWYKLTLITDIDNQKLSYYVDGKYMFSANFSKSVGQISRLWLGKNRGQSTDVIFDDVKLAKINPHPVDTQFTYNEVNYDKTEMVGDNFNTYSGEKVAPNGWAGGTTDAAYVSAYNYDDVHKSSVSVTKTTSDAEFYKNLSSELFWNDKGLYLISADYLFTDKGTQRPLMIFSQAAGGNGTFTVEKSEVYAMMAQNNGRFCTSGGASLGIDYEANRWYRIQALIDVENQVYEFLIDGKVVIGPTAFPSNFMNINRITVAKQRGVGNVLVDNFELYKLTPSYVAPKLTIKADGDVLTDLGDVMTGSEIDAVSNVDTTGKIVVVAIYDKTTNKLLDIALNSLELGENFDSDTQYVKAFMMDGTTLSPLCECASVGF